MRLSNPLTLLTPVVFSLLFSPLVLAEDNRNIKHILAFFDQNNDKLINPYEMLDVALMLTAENPMGITIEQLLQKIDEKQQQQRTQNAAFLAEMDKNQDGKVTQGEVPGFIADFFPTMDSNKDGNLSVVEFGHFNFSHIIHDESKGIAQEVADTFQTFDKDQDNKLSAAEVPDPQIWDRLGDNKDTDDDGYVSRQELSAALTMEASLTEFQVKGDKAVMYGTITAETPARVLQLIFEHPGVRTIQMARVPGSIDDQANLRAATYVRNYGFNTELTHKSMVASGGTDFFLAGNQRKVAKGAMAGVHSWAAPDGREGIDIPRDDPQHQLYLKYYQQMNIPAAFYWYTLEVAPARGIHWMTEDELQQYKFRSQ